MKIRGSVVSLSFIFPHPPEDEKKKKKVGATGSAMKSLEPRNRDQNSEISGISSNGLVRTDIAADTTAVVPFFTVYTHYVVYHSGGVNRSGDGK